MHTPVFVLAFDHRASFMRSFLGVEGEPGLDDVERAGVAKDAVAEGLLRTIDAGAVDARSAAALVDATYGERAIARLRARGVAFAMPVEESGRRELAFEDGWRDRLGLFGPAWAKVLVRSNPGDDPTMRARQHEALRTLASACDEDGHDLMLELLVPPTSEQDRPGYDTNVRPGLVVEEITAIRAAGVTPAIWKIEGFERRGDCKAVAAVAGAPCVVLGRGQGDAAVDRWLRAAGGVEGFAGFAIGRSIWWDPLRRLVRGGSREDAVAAIAASYARFVEVARDAALGG